MKKVIIKILFILIIIASIFLIFFTGLKPKIFQDKLIDLGFTKEEVLILRAIYDEDIIDKLMILENKDLINELINMDIYNKDLLDDYLEYYNNSNLELKKVVKLVNHDIHKIENLEYDDIILSLLDEEYYLKNKLNNYLNYYKNHNNLSAKDIIINVNSHIDTPYYTNMEPTDTSKGILMIVNKHYYLDANYKTDLVPIEYGYTSWGGAYLERETYAAFKKMVDDAKKDGIRIWSQSPYRSYSLQTSIYNRYVGNEGVTSADTHSARPGSSEHQTGYAVDVNYIEDWFSDTKEYEWLINNSYKYGFILRYPLGKEYITGYQFEPWHFRYVGPDVAKEVYEKDITYEEYYAYFLDN